jgi:glycine oxidase
MITPTPRIAIIGGGIIGLSIAWELSRAGHCPTVFDAGDMGRAASWAAGGMLAPDIETEAGEQTLSQLLFRAREAWPEFATQLEQTGAQKIHYQQRGSLFVARDQDDIAKLKFLQELEMALGLHPQWLSGYEAKKIEPHLGRNVIAALHHPDDAQVDNRAALMALLAACEKSGVVLRPHTKIVALHQTSNRVTGIRTAHETITADIVILAAGAWSAQIEGLGTAAPPVRPVKGQMIALGHPATGPLLEKLIWSAGVYLIPQPDRLLLGASVEEMGFDTSLTAGPMMDLLHQAYAILPGIYDLPILESWAGLRPTSRDDAPILGPTAIDGLIMATGHHRNGILLAPLTARIIADFIIGGQWPDYADNFLPSRFTNTQKAA